MASKEIVDYLLGRAEKIEKKARIIRRIGYFLYTLWGISLFTSVVLLALGIKNVAQVLIFLSFLFIIGFSICSSFLNGWASGRLQGIAESYEVTFEAGTKKELK